MSSGTHGLISGRSRTFLALQVTSLPAPSLRTLQTYLYIQILLSCVLAITDSKSKFLLYPASSAGLSLAAGSCRLLRESLVSFADYFPVSAADPLLLQCPAQAPPFSVLGHLHSSALPAVLQPHESLWDKCAGILWPSMSWPELLPTLSLVQIPPRRELYVPQQRNHHCSEKCWRMRVQSTSWVP